MSIKILVDTAIKGVPVKVGQFIDDCEKQDEDYLIAVGFAEKAEKPKPAPKKAAKK